MIYSLTDKIINPTPAKRSKIMRSVKRESTAPEKRVWEIAKQLGLVFDVNSKDLPGSPDLVNIHDKWAVFVHGCFWHAHEGCKKWRIPKTNRSFWVDKFQKNRERDFRKRSELEKLGYDVITLWQCQIDEENHVRNALRRFIETGTADSRNHLR